MNPSNWLQTGYDTIQIGGVTVASGVQRTILNLLGVGVTWSAVDNPTNESTDLTATASGGGSGGPATFANYQQNCSAGGVVVSSAPATVQSISLTGTPSAPFVYQMAEGVPFLASFHNATSETATVTVAGGSSSATVLPGQSVVLTSVLGESVWGPFGANAISTAAPTTNNPLVWNGSSWVGAALNLASAAAVSGLLALANLACGGVAGEMLVTNAGATSSAWVAASGDAQLAASGAFTVTGLQGRAVASTAPTSGYALAWNGSAWAPANIGGSSVTGTGLWYSASNSLHSAAVTLTGDVSQGALATNNLPLTVTGLQGISLSATPPTEGQLMIAATSSSWAPTSLSGDVSGSATTPGQLTVGRINGSTVPAGGSLTAGTILQVSGSAALTYAALNLGTAASITGALPVANLAHGTAAQMLLTNTGATSPAWVTMSGDATIGATGPVTVSQAQQGAFTFGAHGGTNYGGVAWLSGTSSGALYLGPGITEGTTNYVLSSDGTNLTVNTPGSGTLSFDIGGTSYGNLTSSNLTLPAVNLIVSNGIIQQTSSAGSPGYGGATNGLFLGQVGSGGWPTTNIAQGALLQGTSSGLQVFASGVGASGSCSLNLGSTVISLGFASTSTAGVTFTSTGATMTLTDASGYVSELSGNQLTFTSFVLATIQNTSAGAQINITTAAGAAGASSSGNVGALNASTGNATQATSGTAAGGHGGDTTWTLGNGAAGLGGTSNGGRGGNYVANTGNGGGSISTGTAGNGGSYTVNTGNGGPGASTGNNGNGGNYVVSTGAPGTGGSGNTALAGTIQFQVGGTNTLGLGIGGVGMTMYSATQSLTAGGTITMAQSVYAQPLIILTGTTPSATTLVFPNLAGLWLLDLTSVTISASDTLTLKSGTASSQTFTSLTGFGGLLMWVKTSGSNGITLLY